MSLPWGTLLLRRIGQHRPMIFCFCNSANPYRHCHRSFLFQLSEFSNHPNWVWIMHSSLRDLFDLSTNSFQPVYELTVHHCRCLRLWISSQVQFQLRGKHVFSPIIALSGIHVFLKHVSWRVYEAQPVRSFQRVAVNVPLDFVATKNLQHRV